MPRFEGCDAGLCLGGWSLLQESPALEVYRFVADSNAIENTLGIAAPALSDGFPYIIRDEIPAAFGFDGGNIPVVFRIQGVDPTENAGRWSAEGRNFQTQCPHNGVYTKWEKPVQCPPKQGVPAPGAGSSTDGFRLRAAEKTLMQDDIISTSTKILLKVSAVLAPWAIWGAVLGWHIYVTRNVPALEDTGVSFGRIAILYGGGLGAGIASAIIALVCLGWVRYEGLR